MWISIKFHNREFSQPSFVVSRLLRLFTPLRKKYECCF